MKTHAQYAERKLHDMFRSNMANMVMDNLLKSETERLKKTIIDIIIAHTDLTNTDGFYFDGSVRSLVQGASHAALNKVPLHDSLKPEMAEYIKQERMLARDRAKIAQGLAVLLRSVRNNQDVRDALPELLVQFAPVAVSSLQRQLPEAHNLTSVLHIRQFEQTKEMLYFYLGSRLLGF